MVDSKHMSKHPVYDMHPLPPESADYARESCKLSLCEQSLLGERAYGLPRLQPKSVLTPAIAEDQVVVD